MRTGLHLIKGGVGWRFPVITRQTSLFSFYKSFYITVLNLPKSLLLLITIVLFSSQHELVSTCNTSLLKRCTPPCTALPQKNSKHCQDKIWGLWIITRALYWRCHKNSRGHNHSMLQNNTDVPVTNIHRRTFSLVILMVISTLANRGRRVLFSICWFFLSVKWPERCQSVKDKKTAMKRKEGDWQSKGDDSSSCS